MLFSVRLKKRHLGTWLNRRLQPFRYLHSYSGCFRQEWLRGRSVPLRGARKIRLLDTAEHIGYVIQQSAKS